MEGGGAGVEEAEVREETWRKEEEAISSRPFVAAGAWRGREAQQPRPVLCGVRKPPHQQTTKLQFFLLLLQNGLLAEGGEVFAFVYNGWVFGSI